MHAGKSLFRRQGGKDEGRQRKRRNEEGKEMINTVLRQNVLKCVIVRIMPTKNRIEVNAAEDAKEDVIKNCIPYIYNDPQHDEQRWQCSDGALSCVHISKYFGSDYYLS